MLQTCIDKGRIVDGKHNCSNSSKRRRRRIETQEGIKIRYGATDATTKQTQQQAATIVRVPKQNSSCWKHSSLFSLKSKPIVVQVLVWFWMLFGEKHFCSYIFFVSAAAAFNAPASLPTSAMTQRQQRFLWIRQQHASSIEKSRRKIFASDALFNVDNSKSDSDLSSSSSATSESIATTTTTKLENPKVIQQIKPKYYQKQTRRQPKKRPRNYWKDINNMKRELINFWIMWDINIVNSSNSSITILIPNETLLNFFQRHDLRSAIKSYGGRKSLAYRLMETNMMNSMSNNDNNNSQQKEQKQEPYTQLKVNVRIMPGRWKHAIDSCPELIQLIDDNPGFNLSKERPPLSPQQIKDKIRKEKEHLQQQQQDKNVTVTYSIKQQQQVYPEKNSTTSTTIELKKPSLSSSKSRPKQKQQFEQKMSSVKSYATTTTKTTPEKTNNISQNDPNNSNQKDPLLNNDDDLILIKKYQEEEPLPSFIKSKSNSSTRAADPDSYSHSYLLEERPRWSHNVETRKPKGYWNMRLVLTELYEYCDYYSRPEYYHRPSTYMPRLSEFKHNQRQDLQLAIRRFGGYKRICNMARLIPYQDWYYFEGFYELIHELQRYHMSHFSNLVGDPVTNNAQIPTMKIFPSASDIKRAGKEYDRLYDLIQYYGGCKFVAARLGMEFTMNHNNNSWSSSSSSTTKDSNKIKPWKGTFHPDAYYCYGPCLDLDFILRLMDYIRNDQYYNQRPPLRNPVLAIPSKGKLLSFDNYNKNKKLWSCSPEESRQLHEEIMYYGGYENIARRLGLAF